MGLMRAILIIEDNPLDAKVVQFHLEKLGATVTIAPDPHLGIDLLQKQSFDLVLLDWNMPHLSGMDVLKYIRSTRGKTEEPLPVIIMSGRNETKHVKQAVETGANDYIIKPVDLMILEDKVQKIFSKKQEWTFHYFSEPAKGTLKVEFDIISMNEVGAQITSSVPLKVGQTWPLESSMLAEVGVPVVFTRILQAEPFNGKELYTCSFVGLKEGRIAKNSIASQRAPAHITDAVMNLLLKQIIPKKALYF